MNFAAYSQFTHAAPQALPQQQHQIPFQSAPTQSLPWHNHSGPDNATAHSTNGPMAMLASNSGTEFTGPWYPDSGATHHVTSNATNLTHQVDPHGSTHIYMGNGFRLKIVSVGSALLIYLWIILFPSPSLSFYMFQP